MIHYIYKWTNKADGKCYIGISIRPKRRLKQHRGAAKKDCATQFHRALRKYGLKNFDYEILDYTTNRAQAYIWLERFWIQYYDTFNNGYNMTKGGDGGLFKMGLAWNRGLTKETDSRVAKQAKIMSERMSGENNPMYGIPCCWAGKKRPEHSKAMKGRTAWNKGIPASEESKRKRSQTQKGRPRLWNPAKPVVVDGITYRSRKEAGIAHAKTPNAISYWIKNNKHGARYV